MKRPTNQEEAPTFMQKVGQFIKERRKDLNLKQSELSMLAFGSASHQVVISNIENNKVDSVTTKTLETILAVLNVSIVLREGEEQTIKDIDGQSKEVVIGTELSPKIKGSVVPTNPHNKRRENKIRKELQQLPKKKNNRDKTTVPRRTLPKTPIITFTKAEEVEEDNINTELLCQCTEPTFRPGGTKCWDCRKLLPKKHLTK